MVIVDSLRNKLLRWFRLNARPLPWRCDRDPYRIWISEVMLQQTQVATVIPYFERFLKQFPNLHALAAADEQDVLRQWEGLGYYRRARALWQAARVLAAQGHATIPDAPELLRELPGFGRYTANAVLSQAFERRLPIVEANSRRVLCRLFGIDDDPGRASVAKQLWEHAENLLPAKAPGEFNQALMELGALVCTPADPGCENCPLARACLAKAHHRQHEIPARTKQPGVTAVAEIAIILRKRERLLLVQRPDSGRWARLWEVPHAEMQWMEPAPLAARRLLAGIGLKAKIGGALGVIRHSVTRFRITMTCLHARYQAGALAAPHYAAHAWVRPAELCAYPLAAPQRRLIGLLDSSKEPGAP